MAMMMKTNAMSTTIFYITLVGTAQAAPHVGWDRLVADAGTSTTLYSIVSVDYTQLGGSRDTFVIKARFGEPGYADGALAANYTRSRQHFWDGSTVWKSTFGQHEAVERPENNALLSLLFAEVRGGFANTVVSERTPAANGIPVDSDQAHTWVHLDLPLSTQHEVDVFLKFRVLEPHTLRGITVFVDGLEYAQLTIMPLEWNVNLQHSDLAPDWSGDIVQPWGPCPGTMTDFNCGKLPFELADRIAPSGKAISDIATQFYASYGLSPSGQPVMCHKTDRYPDFNYTMQVAFPDVHAHLAHNDSPGACRNQTIDMAVPDPQDAEGKMTLCHIPPGNPDAKHSNTVGINAVPAHLNHGDYLGPCRAPPEPEQKGTLIEGPTLTVPDSFTAPADLTDNAPETTDGDTDDTPPETAGCFGCSSTGGPLTGGFAWLFAGAWLVRRRTG